MHLISQQLQVHSGANAGISALIPPLTVLIYNKIMKPKLEATLLFELSPPAPPCPFAQQQHKMALCVDRLIVPHLSLRIRLHTNPHPGAHREVFLQAVAKKAKFPTMCYLDSFL